ncbi:hypothetical protein SOM61_22280 [Massilia sp. CFBP9012]|nr:hypothetical protein [Massilia sp. CFBP9012]MDY0977693.1 hypothetical protein [Massilia sp. CFBP9012]
MRTSRLDLTKHIDEISMCNRIDRKPSDVREDIHFKPVQDILAVRCRPSLQLHAMPFGCELAKRVLARLHSRTAQLFALLHRILAIEQNTARFGSFVPRIGQGHLGIWAESYDGFLPVRLAIAEPPELSTSRMHLKIQAMAVEELDGLRCGLRPLYLGVAERFCELRHSDSLRLVRGHS